MCPVCLMSVALMTASGVSAGGLGMLVMTRIRERHAMRSQVQPNQKEQTNEQH